MRITRNISTMALLFIFLTVGFTVLGQILVKQGMLEVGRMPTEIPNVPSFLWRALTNVKVVLGFGSAFMASLCWIVAISRSELSFAYPFMGLGIVLVLVLSPIFFGEFVPMTRWLGVLIVCIGIWVASQP
jgi:multidrug transporter EmrE-like cation transporter